jgi:endonuclease G
MIVPSEILRQTEARLQAPPIPPPADRRAIVFGDGERAAGHGRARRGGRPGAGGAWEARRAARAELHPEVIAARRGHLSFAGVLPTPTELERIIGTNDLVDEFYLSRGLVAAQPVCRLVLRDGGDRARGYATGFMISPRLLLTNCHVFPNREEAANAVAQFDYTLDIRGGDVAPVQFRVEAVAFYLSDPRLDFALVGVEPTSLDGATPLSRFGYHRLVPELHKIEEEEWITIIQHPGGGRRQLAIRANRLVDKDHPDFLRYESDTAQGSSGAPAFNDSWQVVALHHSGKAKRDGQLYVLKDGSRVASIDNIDEAKIVWESNEGLRISRLCAHLASAMPAGEYADELRAAMNGGDIMSRTIGGQEDLQVPALHVQRNGNGLGVMPATRSGLSTVQLNIAQVSIAAVNVGSPAPAYAVDRPSPSKPPEVSADGLEKLVEPIVDRDYSTRKGYDDAFLGTQVPLPTVTQKSLVAKMDNGKHVIPYEHFSVVMNKHRRLALFTASNVDASDGAKEPQPGDYSRTALTGLGKNDQEKWVTDERIAAQFQLPDKFYTDDRTAFDKGHIVRREDVCWGKTLTQIRRANGDTFHTTNCSPQVNHFNQSSKGGTWGKLENLILSQAKQERYCIFAGPVFTDDDEVFQGWDDQGKVSIKIPRAFWKVVVAVKSGNLQTFAFLLEQDLSRVKFEYEFQVNQTFAHKMISIQNLEARLTGIKFPAAVAGADQFGTPVGDEVTKGAEIARVGA